MSARRLVRAIQAIPRTLSRTTAALVKRFMTSLLRALFLWGHNPRRAWQGFVLPTTVLMLLMVSLTAGALTFRAYNRSVNVIAQREQQVIANAASPAIDRAKAKLEYLFTRDERIPGGIPGSGVLNAILSNRSEFGVSAISPNPYNIPGEEQVDLNRDGSLDPAWVFPADIDGDGTVADDELIAYSIHLLATDPDGAVNINDPVTRAKAEALVTRNGPINTAQAGQNCGTGRGPEEGWQAINAATLQKNFQIDAFVVNRNALNRTASTLELQQVRQADRGNKWGAWFRYDLESFAGPQFNWNGAMHSEGSFFLGKASSNNNRTNLYLITSQNSCLYSKFASEITTGSDENYQGEFIAGTAGGVFADTGAVHRVHVDQDGVPAGDNNDFNLDGTVDSVIAGTTTRGGALSLNPVELYLRNRFRNVIPPSDPDDPADTGWRRDGDFSERTWSTDGRVRLGVDDNSPYVDDSYRADNRYGPKFAYNDSINLGDDNDIGTAIPDAVSQLVSTPNAVDEAEIAGLDGYWERRARAQGLRVIVGERLELGNKDGWGVYNLTDPEKRAAADSDDHEETSVTAANFSDIRVEPSLEPLYPPVLGTSPSVTLQDGTTTQALESVGTHENLQRLTLRDNLAAVQAMTVYHYDGGAGLDTPLACMAMTAHPGTMKTIIDSRTFENLPVNDQLRVDFLNGVGTNGWEFDFYAPSTFPNDDVLKALKNLAHFAGDPNGGAPSFTPVQDSNIHPYPYMAMWGDFSPLRRIFDDIGLDDRDDYLGLSPADKATVNNAACTMGMLAYNVENYISELDAFRTTSGINSVAEDFWKLINPGTNEDLGNAQPAAGTRFINNDGTYRTFSGTYFGALNGQPIIATPGLQNRNNWQDPDFPTADPPECMDGSNDESGFQIRCDAVQYYSQFSTEDFIRAYLSQANNQTSFDSLSEDVRRLEGFIAGYQIFRDRKLGFIRGSSPLDLEAGVSLVEWDEDAQATLPATSGSLENLSYPTTCDPDIFSGVTAGGAGVAPRRVGLAAALCSYNIDTKYPSLYYLFPIDDHGHNGTTDDPQPSFEQYVSDGYIAGENSGESLYAELEPVDIALSPRDAEDFVTPTTGVAELTDPDEATQRFRINIPGNTGLDVAFLDKGMYDGRQNMSVRMLDIDIQKLTTTNPPGSTDRWISGRVAGTDADGVIEDARIDGIVYAFREDAVREDEIVRPRAADVEVEDCRTLAEFIDITDSDDMGNPNLSSNCHTNAVVGIDPPLANNRISVKPVDYYADPARRPHGFRLQNGTTFNRGENVAAGLTFVTDNTVYIQGDFNVHRSRTNTNQAVTLGNIWEEFTQQLIDGDNLYGFDEFYGNRTNLNNDFAVIAQDGWRPAEIIADSVGILSRNFRDGAIVHGFTRNRGQTPQTSYQNQNRPLYGSQQWIRQTAPGQSLQLDNQDLPVRIGRNVTIVRNQSADGARTMSVFADSNTNDDEGLRTWRSFFKADDFGYRENDQIVADDETMVNALFIAGIVPSRSGQSYGGLHNFPVLNQNWKNKNLRISGGFFQLNFSTAATAPYSQTTWQPGDSRSGQPLPYYQAPRRLWGYDVALQYVPAAPVSRRFVTISTPRSEFYRELPANDPYITLLRCAPYEENEIDHVDPLISPGECPAP